MPFTCECDTFCVEDLPLTDSEFMVARMFNFRAALVLPGHQSPTDVVISNQGRYLIVLDKGDVNEPIAGDR